MSKIQGNSHKNFPKEFQQTIKQAMEGYKRRSSFEESNLDA